MLDYSDKHCRYFYRLLSKEAVLWSEMITTKAILFGDKNRLLDFEDESNKTVLQLGGGDAIEMKECAKIAKSFGYSELNINVGCPSNRVQKGSFGACLMKTPKVVAQCVDVILQNVDIKVSIKHRIGVDDMEDYGKLCEFININHQAGCNDFVVHARKAWLNGLSPKQNRTIPPLNYNWVYDIKRDFPNLNITINGGIKTIDECTKHLQKVDGVMIGREVYHNPFILSQVDNQIYHKNNTTQRIEVLQLYLNYIKKNMQIGVPVRSMIRHALGLYHAQPNSKKFKQMLSGKEVKIKNLQSFIDGY